jgi:glucose-1-phosphate thymidylyltransferase
MKGLIAAGGRATRLRPLTATINKHLIPLAGKAMILHAIGKLVDAGVTDIAINVNPGETEIQKLVGDGGAFGAHITYIEQAGGPKGVANVIAAARDFLGDEPFVFYLGDNVILGDIRRFVEAFEKGGHNALLALAKVRDPQRFGVPVFDGDRIVRVDEKPAEPESDFAVTGIYFYDSSVHEAVASVTPSARGEFEISDVHTWLIEHGRSVGHAEITGWWKDTGKPEDLLEGNALLLDEMTREAATNQGELGPEVRVHGRVRIGPGTRVTGTSVIRGPVSIGANCVIEDTYVGPSTSIGDGVTLRGTEIEHSIVMDGAEISCRRRVSDALVGARSRVLSAQGSPGGHRLIIGDNSLVEL